MRKGKSIRQQILTGTTGFNVTRAERSDASADSAAAVKFRKNIHTEIRELAKLGTISTTCAQAAIDAATLPAVAEYEQGCLTTSEAVDLFIARARTARAPAPTKLRIDRGAATYRAKTLRDAAAVLEATPGRRVGSRSVKNLVNTASFLRNLADEISGVAFLNGEQS